MHRMQPVPEASAAGRRLEEEDSSRSSRLVDLELGLRSDVGLRRSANQDRCGGVQVGDGRWLFVVADGMGGHQGGEVAAQLVVETCEDLVRESRQDLPALAERMLAVASERIHARGASDAHLGGMGSTGTVLLLGPGGEGCVGHVGDSRAYRIRAGEIQALTEDHSLVASMVRAFQMDPSEAEHHPRRNELVRSLGAMPEVQVDVHPFRVEPGDRFLLCSDGLWGQVSDLEMLDLVMTRAPDDAAQALVDLANARGGPDNITVQVVVPHVSPSFAPSLPDRPLPAGKGLRPPTPLLAAIALLTLVTGLALLLWLV